MNKTVYILNGPPTAGKGVWGKILKSLLTVDIVNVGELLRAAQKQGLLSKSISDAMDAGYLLESESIWGFLQPALNNVKGKSFILDGFPRRPEQVIKITEWVKENDYAVRYLNLEQSREKTIFRTDLRKKMVTGTTLMKRVDDNPDAVVTRYNEFEKYTRYVAPLFMANPPGDFAMITLNSDEIGIISKFLINIFDANHDDNSKEIQERLAKVINV
jgi:adenylate kinase family enzyme